MKTKNPIEIDISSENNIVEERLRHGVDENLDWEVRGDPNCVDECVVFVNTVKCDRLLARNLNLPSDDSVPFEIPKDVEKLVISKRDVLRPFEHKDSIKRPASLSHKRHVIPDKIVSNLVIEVVGAALILPKMVDNADHFRYFHDAILEIHIYSLHGQPHGSH